jgi:hypothetical protein
MLVPHYAANSSCGGKDSIFAIRHCDGFGKPLSQTFFLGETIRIKAREGPHSTCHRAYSAQPTDASSCRNLSYLAPDV